MTQRTVTALIIDDCEADRYTYQRYLEADSTYRYQIFQTENSQEGISLAQKIAPDVILLDYLLPDSQGLETLQILRQINIFSNPGIVILTGQEDVEIASQLMKSGAQEYIAKRSLNRNKLISVVHQMLEKRAREQQTISSKQHLNILNIEDAEADRHTFRRYLQADEFYDYTILEAETSVEGLLIAQKLLPDIIILDYQLPDIDGLETLKSLVQANISSHPVIIMVTGQGNEEIAAQAIKAGAQEYLSKSRLTQDRFLSTLHRVIEQQTLKRELARSSQRQQLIADLSLRIHQSLDLQKILGTVVQDIQKVFGYDTVAIYRTDQLEKLDAVAGDRVRRCYYPTARVGTALLQGNSCYRPHHVLPIRLVSEPDLAADGQPWGYLIVHKSIQNRPTSHEARTLADIAIQLGISIQQASLIQQLQSELQERQRAEHHLEIAQAALQQANQDLEIRIQQRTETLLETNQTLHHEVAQRRQAEQAISVQKQLLEKLNNDLQGSNQELKQFAYVASHDLREPLRKISSYTDLLARRYGNQLDDRADKYIKYITDGAVRMNMLIQDLLDYSLVGRCQPERTPVALGQVLSQVMDDLETTIRETQAKISTPRELPTVQGSTTQMRQLFQNLLANSLKYRSSQVPTIDIMARPRGELWEISIKDNGIGIAPEFAERIFVIFQRLHPREAYGGTGIGLAICKRIVECHSGRIWVESQVGAGATFTFTLPAA